MDIEEIVDKLQDIDIDVYRIKVLVGNNIPLKGEYLPDKNKINIYKYSCTDKKDYDITILHELCHALYESLSEEEVEKKAVSIYNEDKDILKFVKSFYKVRKYYEQKYKRLPNFHHSSEYSQYEELKNIQKYFY